MKLRELFQTEAAAALKFIAPQLFKAEKDVAKKAASQVRGATRVQAATDTETEKKEKTAAIGIIFGRFNPPHKGHREAWRLASENIAWYVGTNQDTQGPKDPLPYNVKIEAMKTIWPSIEGHLVAEQSWLTLASYVFKKHPNLTTLYCYTDEAWVTKTIIAYNGKQGPHGFYNFKSIEQKETPRLSSATELRSAVRAGDKNAFANAAGVAADTPVAGKSFFDLVAHYLNQYPVKESTTVKEGTTTGAGGKAKGNMQPMPREAKAGMKNASTIAGANMSSGSAYVGYRMGIAMAAAPDFPAGGEADNWIGGDPLLSAYTDEEWEMIQAAAKQVGAGSVKNWSGNRSQEVADVNKVSPVAKIKRNKYGV